MTYSVRHQVFVSSTFTDLKEERAEVIQALWELDCIPTGMEAFVASNDSQWDVIQKVIDECDYYVLIIGGRYGSVTSKGVSYTEQEYRYAKKIGLPVLAFVHGHPQQIPVGKSEADENLRSKLEAFRNEVMREHPVRNWTTSAELGGLVSRSVVRETKVTPRPGWVRNDGSSPVALLEQLSAANSEIADLKAQVAANVSYVDVINLASGSDLYVVKGSREVIKDNDVAVTTENWKAEATWDDLLKDVGALALNEASELEIRAAIDRFHGWSTQAGRQILKYRCDVETLNEVLIQLRALGYLAKGVKRRTISDKNRYWVTTSTGEAKVIQLLAIPKPA